MTEDNVENTDGQTVTDIITQATTSGELPDKSPFPSMSDEEYQQAVMKQFQQQLKKMVSEAERKKNATKKKKPTRKQLKAKRKQSRTGRKRNK
jgi:hypothetical protein